MNLLAMGSKHSLVVMNSDFKDIKSGRKFKFEASWLIMEECEAVIKEGWDRNIGGTKVEHVIDKLKLCKRMLKK